MARKRPEEDLYAAFYDGAPGDYGTTSGTSRQSIRDILAEEVNQRARTGTVDTAEMDPVPEQDLGEPAETQEETMERELMKKLTPEGGIFRSFEERAKGKIKEMEALERLKPRRKFLKELKPYKKVKPKPKSEKTPTRKPLKKKKTETQVTKAKPKAKEYTRQQKIDYTEKVTGKTFADMPKGLTPKERSDWLKTYTPFLKTPKKKKK